MTTRRDWNTTVWLIVAVLMIGGADVVPAAAQDGEPTRPFRGLFGSTDAGSGAGRDEVLTLWAEAYEAYDDNVLADEGEIASTTPSTASDPTFNAPGFYWGFSGRLAYSKRFQRGGLDLDAGSSLRDYGQLDPGAAAHYAAGGRFQLSRTTALRAGQNIVLFALLLSFAGSSHSGWSGHGGSAGTQLPALTRPRTGA